jgi:hypothetical protein
MKKLRQKQMRALPLSYPLGERVEGKLAETQPERETNNKGKRKEKQK